MIEVRKNRFNSVDVNGELCSCVEHTTTGGTAVFDCDPLLWEKLVSRVEKEHTSIVQIGKGDGMSMRFRSRSGEISLKRMVYAHYKGLSLDEIKDLRIIYTGDKFLPDGSEDCRSCNLAATSDVCLVTRSRRFSVSPDGQHFKLELTPDGEKIELPEYFSNVPGFLELLAKPGNFSFCTVGKDNRVQAVYRDCDGKRQKVYLNCLSFLYYHHLISEDNFRAHLYGLDECLHSIIINGERTSMHVDHFDSNIHNHAEWNLSWVRGYDNLSKRELFSRIKPPYYCYGVTLPDGGYRMRLGFVGKLCQWDVVDCDNFTDAISCLRSFLNIDKKPVFVSPDDGAPVEVYKRDKEAPWMALDFESAATMAEKLLNWDGRIIHWEDGASLGISDHNMISYIPA